MQKMIKLVLLSVGLLLVLVGCGANSGEESKEEVITLEELTTELSSLLEDSEATQLGSEEEQTDEEEFDINPEDIEGSTLEELIATFQHIIPFVETPMIEADFNGDDVLDIVVVLEDIESNGDEPKNRTLLLAFGFGDGTYHFPEYYDNIVYKSDEGGVMGDPFMGLSYDEEFGTFAVNHYGGSNWRWSNKYHIEYRELGWTIVGYSSEWFNASDFSSETLEYDLTLGDVYYETIDSEGNSEQYFLTAPPNGGILIADFNAEEFSSFVAELTTVE